MPPFHKDLKECAVKLIMAVPETALRRRAPGLVLSLNCCSGNKAVYCPLFY